MQVNKQAVFTSAPLQGLKKSAEKLDALSPASELEVRGSAKKFTTAESVTLSGDVVTIDAPLAKPPVLGAPLNTRYFGDATGDGMVDIYDAALLVQQLGQSGDDMSADFNGDGDVDKIDKAIFDKFFNQDVTALAQKRALQPASLTGLYHDKGDINGDNNVNFDDLLGVAALYNQSGDNLAADIYQDGDIDFIDLLTLAKNYNKEFTPPPPVLNEIPRVSEGIRPEPPVTTGNTLPSGGVVLGEALDTPVDDVKTGRSIALTPGDIVPFEGVENTLDDVKPFTKAQIIPGSEQPLTEAVPEQITETPRPRIYYNVENVAQLDEKVEEVISPSGIRVVATAERKAKEESRLSLARNLRSLAEDTAVGGAVTNKTEALAAFNRVQLASYAKVAMSEPTTVLDLTKLLESSEEVADKRSFDNLA